MPKNTGENARSGLIAAAVELFRRNGYVATTVDQICAEAGVTKGAFFHHFASKEELGEACLAVWQQRMRDLFENAPFRTVNDPVEKLLGCIDFFIGFFNRPQVHKSCLVGTMVQEISETHPRLREAAQCCFVTGEEHFQESLDAACRSREVNLDTASLARLWAATLQGSMLLWKASRDDSVVPENLGHFRRYVQQELGIVPATQT